MDNLDRLRAWTFARQRLGPNTASSPLAALRAVVAVYATHPTCPLALRVRTRTFNPTSYRRLDRDGKAVRIPAMRMSVFLVPGETAARVFTAVRATEAHALRPLAWRNLTRSAYERAAERILAAATKPMTTRDLESVAGLKGQDLGAVLRGLRYQGRLVTLAGDSLTSSPHGYLAASETMPDGLDAGDKSAALAWLAGEYLRAFGPARPEDFAWWAGVTKSAARAALAALDTVEVGEGLQLLGRDKVSFGRVTRVRDSVVLLPKWDSYTMGFAPDGRRRFVHPDVQPLVYTPTGTGLPGDGNPVVLVNGEAAALWSFTLKDGPALHPFDSLGSKVRRAVDEELQRIAALLS